MSLLERLQDLLGLGEPYPYDDDSVYGDERMEAHGGGNAYSQGKMLNKLGVVQDNVIEMPGLSSFQSELVVMEPRSFEEVPDAILALRDRKSVILNLTHMDADQAQRSVDYVAGGVFGLEGHQERIGPNVFLFTPNTVQINNYSANPAGFPLQRSGFREPFVPASASPSLSAKLDVRPIPSTPSTPQSQHPPF